MSETKTLSAPGPIWACKIGVLVPVDLPPGSDAPMRRAVARAFWDVAGVEAQFNFSGWSAALTEPELAVVEDRLPSKEHYRETCLRDAAPELLEALAGLVAAIERPNSDEWLDDVQTVVNAAHATIAKAEGHQSPGEGS